MKMLQEAVLDDKFNVQMGKIQAAISKLNDVAAEMLADKLTYPVMSQIRSAEQAARDLTRLTEQLHSRVGARGR